MAHSRENGSELPSGYLALHRGEPEVAYRRGQRLTPILEKVDMRRAERQAPPIQPGGVYLISGGLGGIGTHLAAFLMTTFAVKLILVGRTPLPNREQWPGCLADHTPLSVRLQHYLALEAALEEAGSTGGEFVYAAADVGDLDALQRITAEAESHWQAPLAGIIHLAGDDDLAQHWAEMEQRGVAVETPSTFEHVFRAKVFGAWTLCQLLKERPQASWVAFSSVNSLFGAATFGAYAAASSFLDALIAYLRDQGHPQSYGFNWTMWDEIGMSRRSPEYAREASRTMGYAVISKEQGLYAFIAGLGRGVPQLIVGLDGSNRRIRRYLGTADVQVQRLCAYMASDASEALTPLPAIELCDDFGTPTHCDQVVLTEMPQAPSGEIDRLALRAVGRHALAAMTERAAPKTDLERSIAAIWAEALQTDVVSTSDNFFELGGHSILLAQVHGKLRVGLDRQDLSIVDLFRYPTIRALAAHLSHKPDEKPTYETFQDRAAKQRAALQRQRQFRRHR